MSAALDEPESANSSINYSLSFRNAAMAMFADPIQFHDPHGLKTLGIIKKQLIAEFGIENISSWRDHALSEACLIKTESGYAESHVMQPDLPSFPSCGCEGSVHFTSEMILGLVWNNVTEIRRQSFDRELVIPRDDLVRWLKQNITIDDWSPGMECQALIAAGVPFSMEWAALDGTNWSVERLIEADIARWRKNRLSANLSRGSIVPENMLHVAPALIELMRSRPDLIPRYYPVLKEVFITYENALHPDGYWGFPGEACCTGHIIEQYILAEKAGLNFTVPSLRPVQYMVEHQQPSGWFDIHNVNFVGAQAHGTRALAFSLPML
jgi:hypothetical protein